MSIRFYNPVGFFDNIELKVTHPYFKEECFYRIAAPLIFKEYEKVIFTDIDLILQDDILNLANYDLNGKCIAASKEILWQEMYNHQTVIHLSLIHIYSIWLES